MTAVLVPIALDVLMVRTQTKATDWALTAVDPPKAQLSGHRKHKLIPDPFQTLSAARAPGAYLHWAVPDGLTHGVPGASGTAFPALPNRWLVVRLSRAATPGPRAVDAWLLPDANAKDPIHLAHALTGPALPAPGPTPVKPITALGHGDLAWAAYYDNVVDRFALYDDLTGVNGPIAYLVCGWYTDPSQDPLASTSESDFHDRMARMRWELDADLPTGAPFPTSSIYHASALSIGWPSPTWPGDGGSLGAEPDLRPKAADVRVSLGETLAEAVATLVPGADIAGLGQMLEATISGGLGNIASADGPAVLDTALHVSRFGSKPLDPKTEFIWEPAPATSAAGAPPPDSGNFREVKRTLPRAWHALDPSIVVQSGGRSAKHGGDGRYTTTGNLVCRVEGETVTEFGVATGNRGLGVDVLPASALSTLPATYGTPAVAWNLLIELACLDPGSAPDLASATATQTSPVAAARARWWTSFDPANPASTALDGANVVGTLPSPVGVTTPMRPWTPLHLEWKASYLPSPRGAHDWILGDTDFQLPSSVTRPGVDANHPLAGRAMLSGTPGLLLQGTAAAGGTTDFMGEDLLSGAFTDIAALLRGDSTDADIHKQGAADPAPDTTRPANFLALRAGFLQMERLRLVDGYGQYVDLLGGSGAAASLAFGSTFAVPRQSDLGALRPRFTAPARALFRFADASGAQVEAGGGVSPVCGYVVASPLDGTLEFFDADGAGYGRLRPDAVSATAWEPDPGQTTLMGARPSSVVPNAFLGKLADGILAADTALAGAGGTSRRAPSLTALRSLVAVLDTTEWSVDVTGRAGDEHLALLLGHPVAVIRAVLKVEVMDPRQPPENETTSVPVKLGTLAHEQDGLLAYFVGDAFDRVHIVDPAVSDLAASIGHGTIDSPYVDQSASFFVNPGVEVPVTLLMVPGSDVHITTGLLPQKSVGLVREWTAPALTRLSPALRFGPVLRDGDATRLPVSPDIRGNWLWHRRDDPSTWATDAVIPATVSALLPDNPVIASDGWLQVELLPDTSYFQHAVQVQVTHVQKTGSTVTALGGLNPDGSHFVIPIPQAVQLQESGRFIFYVQRSAADAPVFTKVIHARSGKYLRTSADSKSPNNLDSLPRVPLNW